MIALAPQRRTDVSLTPPSPSERGRARVDPQPASNGPSPFPASNEALDLRRSLHRDYAELIISRASALPPQERALLESVYDEGLTVARLAGLRNECPRALRRKMRRLIARVLCPKYAFVVRHRDTWPTTRKRVAKAVVVEGRSMRSAANALGLSFHTVRKEMQLIDALFETRVHA